MADRLQALFQSPDPAYSPVPFWFLNGPMDCTELRRQLVDFRDHGVHGVVMHPRMGFDPTVPYLSPAFMDWMAYIVETAHELDMFVFLYDEGMYPSGAACGQVVQENPAYAARGLFLCKDSEPASGRMVARIAAVLTDGCYDPAQARLLTVNEQPAPGETLLYLAEDFSHGTIRGLLPTQDDGLPDAPPAADLLNTEAVQCFIRLTHERYYARMPQYFGNTIRAMFTDEPNPIGRCAPAHMRPWSTDTAQHWLDAGYHLTDLPALFMDAVPAAAHVVGDYEHFLQQCMLRTYYRPLQTWCESHGIALTGHPAHADSIALERAFTTPGQDLVWHWVAPGASATQGVESTQAHCAADSMLNTGKRRCLNECFGCCGPKESQWGMSVADMRWMMDYLFVRGVNMLAPHAFFYHMDPVISAQDRPPDVGPNNYWWPHFRQIADYMIRMCGINAEADDQTQVAVLTDGEHLAWQLTETLQQQQLPFHYLECSDLLSAPVENGTLMVCSHPYRAIIATPMHSQQIADRLQALAAAGMLVIDPAAGMEAAAQQLRSAGHAPVQLIPATPWVRVSNRKLDGAQVLMLFNEGDTPWAGDVQLPAAGYPELWDAWTGKVTPLPAPADRCALRLEAKQSVLLVIRSEGSPIETQPAPAMTKTLSLDNAFTLTLPDRSVMPMTSLCNWQTIKGLETYNGTLTYTATVSLDQLPAKAVLDLGCVHEIAEITVNSGAAQVLLLPPFAVDIAPWLHVGENKVTVRVTSVRVTDYEKRPWPCGLFGPVSLQMFD